MLYRRSPPTPPHRLLQVVAVSGVATILGFTACFSKGQLASTGDAGDEQGGSGDEQGGSSGASSGGSGFSGSNGGGCATSCGGSSGTSGSSSGVQMLLDAAGDAIEAAATDAAATDAAATDAAATEAAATDAAADVADDAVDAATPDGGSE
jgi:hypothetical protein